MYIQNYKSVYIKRQLRAYIRTKYEVWKCDNYKVTSRGRPIRTLGTSEPIETSVNRSRHGTDADVVKKRLYATDIQA